MQTDPVRIFNRAPHSLIATKNGRQYTLPPGYSFLRGDVVRFARQQNPIPGTENASDHTYESLISRVADPNDPKALQVDDLDPIPADVLEAISGTGERIDRSTLPPDRQNSAALPMRWRKSKSRLPMENPQSASGVGLMQNDSGRE